MKEGKKERTNEKERKAKLNEYVKRYRIQIQVKGLKYERAGNPTRYYKHQYQSKS